MKLLILVSIFTFSIIPLKIYSQDDLLNLLEEEIGEETYYTAYTFKSTRIINGHSIERMKARQLDFRVNHRFGEISSGSYDLWGLDNAIINFSLEYGITDWLMVGVRRGTYQKTYDGSVKFTILKQSTGKKNMPISMSYYTDISAFSTKITDPNQEDLLKHRLAYVHQLLIARKFNEQLSLQLSPTFVHRNQVTNKEENDALAIGIGGRYKFSRRVAFMYEYFAASHTLDSDDFFNPLAIGFDIETGGHVFQLFFTNSVYMVEKGFIAETTNSAHPKYWHFGFNISRVFGFKGAKKTLY